MYMYMCIYHILTEQVDVMYAGGCIDRRTTGELYIACRESAPFVESIFFGTYTSVCAAQGVSAPEAKVWTSGKLEQVSVAIALQSFAGRSQKPEVRSQKPEARTQRVTVGVPFWQSGAVLRQHRAVSRRGCRGGNDRTVVDGVATLTFS